MYVQGRIQDFHLGEGGAKDYVNAGTLQAQKSKSLSAGVQGPLGSFRVCYFSFVLSEPYFLSILIQTGIENKTKQSHSRSKFRGGGGGGLLRPLWIRHCTYVMLVVMCVCECIYVRVMKIQALKDSALLFDTIISDVK